MARTAACPVVQVESDVVVPVELVSNKAEYAARTIRPKIHRHLDDYLVAFASSRLKKKSLGFDIDSLDLKDIGALLDKLVPGPTCSAGGPVFQRRHLAGKGTV